MLYVTKTVLLLSFPTVHLLFALSHWLERQIWCLTEGGRADSLTLFPTLRGRHSVLLTLSVLAIHFCECSFLDIFKETYHKQKRKAHRNKIFKMYIANKELTSGTYEEFLKFLVKLQSKFSHGGHSKNIRNVKRCLSLVSKAASSIWWLNYDTIESASL